MTVGNKSKFSPTAFYLNFLNLLTQLELEGKKVNFFCEKVMWMPWEDKKGDKYNESNFPNVRNGNRGES